MHRDCWKRWRELGLPLLVHGEVTDPAVDIFDREQAFIERSSRRWSNACRSCAVVFEHITTQAAVDFVLATGKNVAPPSRPITCCTTAMPCSRAACARTTTACRCSNANGTGKPWCKAAVERQSQILPGHRQCAACACSQGIRLRMRRHLQRPRPRSNCMPRSSSRQARLSRLEAFASFHGADFYGLPRNHRQNHPGEEALDTAGELSICRAADRAAARR